MELPACAGVCRTNLLHSGPIPNEIGGKSLETQQKMTITMDYHKKFKKLADVFASDVVRDGTTKIKGPLLTGESLPVSKVVGSNVIGGGRFRVHSAM